MKHKHITILFVSAAVLFLIAVPTGAFYQMRRQQRLDRELIVACNHLDIAAVRQTLRAGASPNAIDFSLWPQPSLRQRLLDLFVSKPNPASYRPTALVQAYQASMGRRDSREKSITPIVQLLLDAGAQPNIGDIFGKTLVDTAFEFQYSRPSAILLLKKGAHPAYLPKCLVIACDATDMEAMKLLLQCGADPNASGRLGCTSVTTPLECAITNKQPAMVSYLLQHGANPNLPVNQLALPMAKHLHEKTIVSLLRKAGAKEYSLPYVGDR